MEQRYFVATHKDADVLKKSSSGGVFTAITDEWFLTYGDKAVVYGCILDEDLKAKHIRAAEPDVRDKMRGSKYIESDVSGVFKQVLNDLENGFYVVFSGTPCQIAGLKSFLNAKGMVLTDNLLTIEVLCHGVGSNRFFDDYIHHLEKIYKSTAVKCNFRAKSRPHKNEDMEVVFSNRKKYNASSTKYDWFYSAYISGSIIRPSCFDCRFAKPERNADICISDNWKGMCSEKDCKFLSAVITATDMGYKWLTNSGRNMNCCEKTLEEISQSNLHTPTPKPSGYDKFWQIYSGNDGYIKVQRHIGNHTLKGYVRVFIADLLEFLHLTETAKLMVRLLKKIAGRK